MRALKVFLALLAAVFFGFVIHFNWGWLNQSESIVFFLYHPKTVEPAPVEADAVATGDEGTVTPDATVERRYQTVPLPIWGYLLISLVAGAFFMLIGSFREILLTRRERRKLIRERRELAERYGQLRGPDDQDVAYNIGDIGQEDLRP